MVTRRILLSLALCISAVSVYPALAGGIKKAEAQITVNKAAKFPLFFVTDRQIMIGAKGPEFSADRAGKLTYGTYTRTNISDEAIDGTDIKVFKNREEFVGKLHATGSNSVAVFVHGYRKSFDGSLQFGEKIANELNQPVVVFAWPSKNKYSAYMADECTAEWSSYHLATVLTDLSNQFGAGNTNLISHSLGARIVTWSLKQVALQKQMIVPFASNILFSPDVDRDTFMADSSFLKQASQNVRIFLDAHDTRIWASMMLHGSPRVGTADNSMIGNIFPYDSSLPSHHIPYSMLSTAFPTPVAAVPAKPRDVGFTHLSSSVLLPEPTVPTVHE